jgi:site-specific DNA-cytosine methylase
MKESKKKVTMTERMQTLFDKGQINKEGQCIDLYNVITHDDVFCSVTTRVDASIYYVTQNQTKQMEDKNAIELPSELKGKKFRIRKLTPRECFRLMGVSDDDIDKIQASGISNSSQYKLAGNSIVAGGNQKDKDGNVDGVLYNIFRKMFIEKENESSQLTLF